jgi:hypothetical protein
MYNIIINPADDALLVCAAAGEGSSLPTVQQQICSVKEWLRWSMVIRVS